MTNTSKTFIQKIQYKTNHEYMVVTRNLYGMIILHDVRCVKDNHLILMHNTLRGVHIIYV